MKTPKNVVCCLRSSGTLSIIMLYGKSTARALACLKLIKLVFSMLRDNLLHLNQVDTLGNSWLSVRTKVCNLSWEQTIFVSSANKIKDRKGLELIISLMYNRKSKGPKIDPCGTPQFIDKRLNDMPLKSTYCCLLDK